MTLTIHTNGAAHIWRTGDSIPDLRHAITLLTQYADEMEMNPTPAQVAASNANPLPEPL